MPDQSFHLPRLRRRPRPPGMVRRRGRRPCDFAVPEGLLSDGWVQRGHSGLFSLARPVAALIPREPAALELASVPALARTGVGQCFPGATVPFFAVAAGPVLAWNLQEYFARRPVSIRPRERIALGVLTSILGLVVLACAWPGWLQAPPYEPRRLAVEVRPSLEAGAIALRAWRQQGNWRPISRPASVPRRGQHLCLVLSRSGGAARRAPGLGHHR